MILSTGVGSNNWYRSTIAIKQSASIPSIKDGCIHHGISHWFMKHKPHKTSERWIS